MASDLEKFKKNIIGSQNRIVDFVPLISATGDFSRISNIQAVLTSWNNILLTPIRTYVANPEYGSELYKYIFEPADDGTIEAITNEIQYRLMLYDNRAELTNINVTFMSDGHGFIVDIDLRYDNRPYYLGRFYSQFNESYNITANYVHLYKTYFHFLIFFESL